MFAAASTSVALDEVARAYQKESGLTPRFSYGGSRDLARQIRAGAPADVIVSADAETVDGLVKDGLVRGADRRRLMGNQLVVIAPAEGHGEARFPDALQRAARIALGDPATVPAGIYAKKWLESAALWPEVKDKIVPTLDVRAALVAVEAGHAEVGIVYRTDAASSRRVRVIHEVPIERGPTIDYVAGKLARSSNPAATSFLDFLSTPAARAIFASHGFVL